MRLVEEKAEIVCHCTKWDSGVVGERIEKEWEDIPTSECQKLIESMPRRIEAVIKARGGYTKY